MLARIRVLNGGPIGQVEWTSADFANTAAKVLSVLEAKNVHPENANVSKDGHSVSMPVTTALPTVQAIAEAIAGAVLSAQRDAIRAVLGVAPTATATEAGEVAGL